MYNDQYLRHYGMLGMRWGTHRGQKKIDRLIAKVDRSMQKFDAGSRSVDAETFRSQSRKVRRLTYKANKRIAKMNKYLNETKGESANNLIVKYERDPQKVAQVKDYLAKNQIQTKRLSELRTSLMDIKIDTL